MYSTSLVVLVVAVLTYEMMQDYDVGGTAVIGAISAALASPAHTPMSTGPRSSADELDCTRLPTI